MWQSLLSLFSSLVILVIGLILYAVFLVLGILGVEELMHQHFNHNFFSGLMDNLNFQKADFNLAIVFTYLLSVLTFVLLANARPQIRVFGFLSALLALGMGLITGFAFDTLSLDLGQSFEIRAGLLGLLLVGLLTASFLAPSSNKLYMSSFEKLVAWMFAGLTTAIGFVALTSLLNFYN